MTSEGTVVPTAAAGAGMMTGPAPRAAGTVGPDDLEAFVAERIGSAREARWLVERVDGDTGRALALADRRAAGEPLQYVLGRWAFRSLELSVDGRVLIPRPETEQVVEVALGELASLVSVDPATTTAPQTIEVPGRPGPVCLDLGTGSGAIALSLAVEGAAVAPGLVVWATDASGDALDVAASNLDELARRDPAAADRVRLAHGRWFGALPAGMAGTVDLLVSNPPYVAEADFPHLDPTVRDWEPRSALVAPDALGVGGMADIEAIIADAALWLRPTGVMVMEIDPAQAEATLEAARRAGWSRCGTRRDLAGRVRMLVARR
jgi:release factor glutamine methyltransferase